MEGTVVKLHLENFITFRVLTVHPNLFLNFITGPNGTGKSSLMCAMCLGLAGKPRVVGRASSVSEYIRYNAESAKIDLELYNPKGANYKISRTIYRDNKSSWTLNNFACTQKEDTNTNSTQSMEGGCLLFHAQGVQKCCQRDKEVLERIDGMFDVLNKECYIKNRGQLAC